ncbi:MAG: dihydroorotate dehydrogenase, partial [Solirubrobacterales bacterium]|nr:dihydroorotate dehydrogenase [Solirubrobacterales bacterium]
AIDPESDRPWLGAGSGGLSGPAIRPIALQQVRAVAAEVSIPVVGMGGVTDGRSAYDFIRAGATVVAVGTENFRDPLAGLEVLRGLEEVLRGKGVEDLGPIRGNTLT